MYRELNTKFYHWALAFVSSSAGITFLAVWSFCEAGFWFVAPDFLLILFAILKPAEKNKFFSAALLASFLGGVTYYVLNLFAFGTVDVILHHTPFVTDRMIEFVQETYAHYGHLGILIQSFSFISFKIWTHVAVETGFNPFIFFFLVIVSRILRLYPVTWLSAYISGHLTNFLKKHFFIVFATYSIIFFTMLVVFEKK